MPLGQRAGDKSDSRYCGVEADFIDGMPHLLTHSLSGGFDFIVSPLVDPNYRPSLSTNNAGEGFVLPVAASDLIVSPAQWSSHVVGKISPWIDLDSENEKLRMDSEMALKQEISWASHLSVQVVALRFAFLLSSVHVVLGCCLAVSQVQSQVFRFSAFAVL